MIELIRTADPILLSWLKARLTDEGIAAFIFDEHTSAVYGGALTAVEGRVMVADDDIHRARRVLAEAPADAFVGASIDDDGDDPAQR